METAQIMMMPAAAASTTSTTGVAASCTAGACTGEGFGSLLGQTLVQLQQNGIALVEGSAEQAAAGELAAQMEMSQDMPDVTVVLARLADEAEIEVLEQPAQSEIAEQERAQQLAGFMQAAMLVPVAVTPATVTALAETGAAGEESVAAVQLVAAAGDVSEEQPEVDADGIPRSVLQATAEATPRPTTVVEQQTTPHRNAELFPSVMQGKSVAAVSGRATPDPVQQHDQLGRQVAEAVQAAEPSAQPEAVKTAAAEVKAVVVDVPAAPKGAPSSVASVRFAQPADVVAAMAQPEQERQQDQAMAGQQQSKVAGALMPTERVPGAGEDVGRFELQLTAANQPEAPAGNGLGTAVQRQQGGTQEPQLAETSKAAAETQVMRQVVDRLTTHEIKQGNDRISLKLSPEHLGNLQLNLRMEDQQVRVEIVAEHRAAREALLQQVDQLRESLSRQNIKMESFDVTTANNGGLSQQQNGDWRQTASERRPLYAQQYGAGKVAAATAGGIDTSMQYFAPQYQSTLDVRF